MDEIKKLYYSISEVESILGITQSNIRFWLSKMQYPVGRTKRNERKFTPEDIEVLKEMKRLVKVEYYSLHGALLKLNNWKA